jgi:hypothetical protein
MVLFVILAFSVVTPATAFSCTVTRVHDGDGPLWCSNGIKVRIAAFRRPIFKAHRPVELQIRAGRPIAATMPPPIGANRSSSAWCYGRRCNVTRPARATAVLWPDARCPTVDRCRARLSHLGRRSGGIDTGGSIGWGSADRECRGDRSTPGAGSVWSVTAA